LGEVGVPGPLAAGKIRNSNQVMLCALAEEAGAAVVDLGTVGDDAGKIGRMLERGLAEADLLVVCGGMSMGTKDLVPGLLKGMGVALHVEKVAMKPGKPLVLGVRGKGVGRRYVAGLPGNPVSAFVCFQRFVREMLRKMEGALEGARVMRARLGTPLPANGEREFYVPCVVRNAGNIQHQDTKTPRTPGDRERGEGELVAEVLPWKSSADIFALGRANGLVVQAAGSAGVATGSWVEVVRW
jgi:molybdopterin molybdotransferase